MSRGIKDLRELVVVSRLSYRESDSESDDGRGGMITPFESLEISERFSDIPVSPTPTPPSSADSGIGRRRKKKKKKPKGYMSYKVSHPLIAAQLHEFPKAKPLPAVGSGLQNGDNARSASSSSGESISMVNGDAEGCRLDFSVMLSCFDEDIVADWLQRSNDNLKTLTIWCTDTNFVKFAQFWITDFGLEKRCQILALEHSILLDEFTLAFQEGIEAQKLRQRDITEFLSALFREYPKRLTSTAGVYLFLDYLDIFTSERTMEYRKILSDVKLYSTNKAHIQLILASRCFVLINVWIAIINFYRQVCESEGDKSQHNAQTDLAVRTHRDKLDVHCTRLVEAINQGLVEAVHYYLYSGKCSAGYVDTRQKTLLHIATAANQPRVVEYLLKKWTGCLDVNRACDTGNTPLHVAVNLGSLKLVQLLLNMPDIEVNKENVECDGATPLHLAALHGHRDIVKALVKYKADVSMKMAGQSTMEIAKDFGHTEIFEFLNAAQQVG